MNPSKHVKLIANPGAGKPADSDKNLKLVVSSLRDKGLKADVAFASPKEEATRIARKAVKDGYKIVVAMGGNGTVKAAMRGLVGSKTRLGIIPVGRTNPLANSLGIPKDLEEACDLIASDRCVKLDVGQIKYSKGKKRKDKKLIFFEVVTIGLASAIYSKPRRLIGRELSSLKNATLNLLHPPTKPKVLISMNDESQVSVETLAVMVSNTPVYGSNHQIAPEASMQDGLLDISLYPSFNKPGLLNYYRAILNNGDYSGNTQVQHYRVHKVSITSTPKLKVMADGADLGRGSVTIKARPGALRVIATGTGPALQNFEEDMNEGKYESVPKTVVKNNLANEHTASLG